VATARPEHGRADPERLRHGLVRIGQQRDRDAVLVAERVVRVEILRGDPDDDRVQVRHVLGALGVRAELPCAHGREVAGVEQQHDALAAVVGQPEGALRALQLEVGGRVADLGCVRHVRATYPERGQIVTSGCG
jgi:hypothetical protein